MAKVKIQLKIIRETDLAYLVNEVDVHGLHCSSVNKWLPKSQVKVDTVIFEMPKWMASKNGFKDNNE